MITPDEAARFSQAVFGLFVAWLLYWFPYRWLLLDRYRQDLFAIRDELFDRAGQVPGAYQDPAYVHLRLMINGLIRYAHRTSPMMLISVWAADLLDRSRESPSPFLSSSLGTDWQSCLNETHARAMKRLARFIFWDHYFSGPPLWACLKLRSYLHYGLRPKPLVDTKPFRAWKREAIILGGDSPHTRQLVRCVGLKGALTSDAPQRRKLAGMT